MPCTSLWTALLLSLVLISHAVAADHCVVLRYQHISDDTPGISSITPQLFQQHLDHLMVDGYEVLPLTRVIDAFENGEPLPDRCVALTIDGSHVSIYSEAFPRVQRYDFPLTVFISTYLIDQAGDQQVNWDQVREMHAAGVRFENLGHSQTRLIRLRDEETMTDWEQRVAVDILTAQDRIRSETGATPTLFAYPYGEYNTALQEIVHSMGLHAFAQQSGPAWPAADLAALPRFSMVSIHARMATFRKRIESIPLPITGAFPTDPVVPVDDWQPALTLVFESRLDAPDRLRCYLNGSPEVTYEWLDQPPGSVVIRPKGQLQPGHNRTDCLLSDADEDRTAWYSHNWIRREADGSWYR